MATSYNILSGIRNNDNEMSFRELRDQDEEKVAGILFNDLLITWLKRDLHSAEGDCVKPPSPIRLLVASTKQNKPLGDGTK